MLSQEAAGHSGHLGVARPCSGGRARFQLKRWNAFSELNLTSSKNLVLLLFCANFQKSEATDGLFAFSLSADKVHSGHFCIWPSFSQSCLEHRLTTSHAAWCNCLPTKRLLFGWLFLVLFFYHVSSAGYAEWGGENTLVWSWNLPSVMIPDAGSKLQNNRVFFNLRQTANKNINLYLNHLCLDKASFLNRKKDFA